MNAPPTYPPFPPGSPFDPSSTPHRDASTTEDPSPAPSRRKKPPTFEAESDSKGVSHNEHAWPRSGANAHEPELDTRSFPSRVTAYRGLVPAPKPTRPTAPARGRDLAALFGFVVLADVLLYTFGNEGTAQGAFFLVAAVLAVVTARKARLSLRASALLGLLSLISVHLAWQGGGLGTVVAMGLLAASTVVVRMKHAIVPDVLASMGATAWASFGRLLSHARGARSLVLPPKDGPTRPPFAWSTVLAPLAALALFTGVFLLANPVLEAWATRAFGSISLPSPVRPLFWMLSALAGAAILKPALRRVWQAELGPRSHVAQDDSSAISEKAHGMARNTLIAVNAIFLLENAVDALSLWVGRPPAGLGYTEYAHRGTAWLTFALFLSTALLGAIFRGAFHFDPRATTVRKLAYVWAVQNVVLALGTFRRIQLYVDLSGLTSLRILGILGTALVVTGLVFVLRMIATKRTIGWLVSRQLDALVVFSVLYLAAPTELVSSEWNQTRIFAGQYAPLLNVVVSTHADENVPALVKLLAHPDPIVRKGTAALLSRRAAPNLRTLSGVVAARSLERNADTITKLSPPEETEKNLEALEKLAGLANEDEARWDYRGRGGVRSDSL